MLLRFNVCLSVLILSKKFLCFLVGVNQASMR